MWGLSFIQAGFLVAGLAAAVPLLIHLFFRQRSRQLPIGSIRFLQSVVRQHRRRRRVQQWILLALRCLAVLLLAVLFARPFVDAAARHGSQQELVLLIDRSASMSAEDTRGRTPFSVAVTYAKEEIAQLDEQGTLHLGLFDATGVKRISVSQLSAAKASAAATDYALSLSWARDVLSKSRRTQRRIVLITDLQQSGVHRSSFAGLPEGTELMIRDVGKAVSRNVAILSAEAVRTEIRPKEPVLLRILVQNFAPLPTEALTLKIRLKGPMGDVHSERSVQLEGGSADTLDVPLDITRDGLYSGEVLLASSDGADWDNRRWFAFEARHPDRILLVDGQEGRSAFANETYYLETALRLRSVDSNAQKRSFELERIVWEAGEGFPNLNGFRAILLANLRSLSDRDVQRLTEYVRNGGNLLVFAGDQTKPSDLDALAEAGVFPGIAERTAVSEPLRVTRWESRHVALEPFADPQRGDLRKLQVHRSLPLKSLADGANALIMAGSHVLAAEREHGDGRCIYIGTTADREWNHWPQTRLYVPIIRQLMAYLTGQLGDRPRVSTKLVNELDESPGLETREGRILVRNCDPQESVPDRLTKDQLCAALALEETKLAPQEQARRAAIAIPADAQRPDEIWTRVAWLLLAVLAVELLLASRIHA